MLPPKRRSVPSPEMNRRMTTLMTDPGNMVCADCPARKPRWVSFLFSPADKDARIMGVLCCTSCAQHHHFELGEKRCMIKYIKMAHEWQMEDIRILEATGNAFANAMFEANLTDEEFDKQIVLSDTDRECSRRAKYIKHKYKRQRYTDDILFHQQVLRLLQKQRDNEIRTARKSWPNESSGRYTPSQRSTDSTSKRRSIQPLPQIPETDNSTRKQNESCFKETTSSRMAACGSKATRRNAVRNLSRITEAERNETSVGMPDESLQLDALQSSEQSSFSGVDQPQQRARRFNSENLEAYFDSSDSSTSGSSVQRSGSKSRRARGTRRSKSASTQRCASESQSLKQYDKMATPSKRIRRVQSTPHLNVLESDLAKATDDCKARKSERDSARSKKLASRSRSLSNPESTSSILTAIELSGEDSDVLAGRQLRRRKEKLLQAKTPPRRGSSSDNLKAILRAREEDIYRNVSRSSSGSSQNNPAA